MQPPAVADPKDAARQAFLSGLASQQAGQLDDAEAHYRASLALLPGRASTLVNLAAVLLAQRRPSEALACTDDVLAADPQDRDALLHRGAALLVLGQCDAALTACDALLALDDKLAPVWLRRAHVLERLSRAEEAAQSYQRALKLAPNRAAIWTDYGGLLRETGHLPEAAAAFREARRLGGDAQMQDFYLAAVDGSTAPGSAPASYVRQLFDPYASEFESHLLGQLGYRAHMQLVDGLVRTAGLPGSYASALDLGCGTGLCGPLVRAMCRRLTGVDLSPGMLAEAKATGVYDQLVEADVVAHLRGTADVYDLMLAADLFIYIGDLEPVFDALQRALPQGVLCFTAEAAADDVDHVLLPSLRYAHGAGYLRRLAATHGWQLVDMQRDTLRVEQGQPIAGWYVYLRR